MVLNRDQILAVEDLPHKDVEVPEWKGSVRIRTMTAGERDDFESSVNEIGTDGKVKFNRENFRAKLLAKVIVGEDGKRLFTDADIKALGSKSAAAINRLFAVAQEINGLSAEVKADAEKK
jgi:hypothetical protein